MSRSTSSRDRMSGRRIAADAVPESDRQLYGLRWVFDCKPPFGGPDQVPRCLGAYTHRVAISNHASSPSDDQVTFRWRDSGHNNKQRLLTLYYGGVASL
jgi:hypothetical protein